MATPIDPELVEMILVMCCTVLALISLFLGLLLLCARYDLKSARAKHDQLNEAIKAAEQAIRRLDSSLKLHSYLRDDNGVELGEIVLLKGGRSGDL